LEIFDFDGKSIDKLKTFKNLDGIFDVYEQSDDLIYLIYPYEKVGYVSIYNIIEKKFHIEPFSAHQSQLHSLYFSNTGKFFSTTSKKGTTIKIFDFSNNYQYKKLLSIV
jgi:WD40 repeat protein